MKKRILAVILIATIAISSFQISHLGVLKTSAESAYSYTQDFESISNFSALNWQKASYSNNFATWDIVENHGNKQLIVDNLTARAKGATAYIVASDDQMSSIVNECYEVCLDITVLDVDKATRWCAIQLNNKDNNSSGQLNYTRIAFRGAGYGAFETAIGSKTTKHGSGVYDGTNYAAFDDTSQVRWNIGEKTSVRIVVDKNTQNLRIYINNKLNAVSNSSTWGVFETASGNNSAVALYVSDNIKVAFDNLSIKPVDAFDFYKEDFEDVADFSALKYKKIAISNDSATWEVAESNGDRQLVIDNLTTPSNGDTAYTLFSDDKMSSISDGSYEVCFDLTILGDDKTGNQSHTRWCAIQLNNRYTSTSEGNSYTRIAFRGAGYGAFETRIGSEKTLHGSGVWDGKTYDAFESNSRVRWGMNERFSVRIAVDYTTDTVRIYINDELVSVSRVNTFDIFKRAAKKSTAIALYVGESIKIAFDNFKVNVVKCENHSRLTNLSSTATKNNAGVSCDICKRCGCRLTSNDFGDCIWDDENHSAANGETKEDGDIAYCICGENLAFWGNGANKILTAEILSKAVKSNIRNVFIRGGITGIEDNAFFGMTRIKKVYISENTINIGANSFNGITAKVFYPTKNASFTKEYKKSYGGNLYWQGDSFEYSDINGDGTTDSNDIVLLRKSLIIEDFCDIADINGDAVGNVLDLILIIKLTEVSNMENENEFSTEMMGIACNLPSGHNPIKRVRIGTWEISPYENQVEQIRKSTAIAFETVSTSELEAFAELKQNKGYEIKDDCGIVTIFATNGEMLYLALTKVVFGETRKNYTDSYRFPTREEYVNNPDLFETVWQYIWKAPKWLTSYEEKKASFASTNRPMCWAHRGGGDYYPENSVEAIISSIKMGADIMELDFRYTKDKKIVLMHYETLHQSTDWATKRGKNGLPTSDKLEDWTYAQLQQLNLKVGRVFSENNESANTYVSEYKIPTLEDVLYACNNRAFFIMDKMNTYEEWDTISSIIIKTKCAEPFAFAYDFPKEEVEAAQQEITDELGSCGPYFYLRKHSGSLERECLSADERLSVFEEFSNKYPNAVIMTNYVKDLIEYIDRNYRP